MFLTLISLCSASCDVAVVAVKPLKTTQQSFTLVQDSVIQFSAQDLPPHGNSRLTSHPLVLPLPLLTSGTNLRVHFLSATLSRFIYASHYIRVKLSRPALKWGPGCGHIVSTAGTNNPQT